MNVCMYVFAAGVSILPSELQPWKSYNSYTRRSMLEKGIFFKLISNLFCAVNRGFVDPSKIVPMKLITLFRMEIS
jgi:hypothetical protein